MFSFRLTFALATILALGSSLGCSRAQHDPRAKNVLRGSIRYGGQPVWEGHVLLLGKNDRVSTTTLKPDGTFEIVNPPLGTVRVGVVNYPRHNTATEASEIEALPPIEGQAECTAPLPVSVKLPSRFAEPDTSEITLEIEAGEQQCDLLLPLREGDPDPVTKPDGAIGGQPGQQAPEIRGDDLAGEPMLLSEYRGKVVALVFWAHWCNLCREQFPHYASLGKRFEGQPFALVGVNCDPDRQWMQEQNELLGIPWRSWWDGASHGGPVFQAYRIEGFPCVVLIDQEGKVRERRMRGDELERAIELMLKEVSSSSITLTK